MKLSLFLGCLGWLFALVTAAPMESIPESSLVKRVPQYQWYFDVTATQHQTNFNKWSAAGYRMISLNVYGLPPNHRYAAVWVLRSGSAWVAIQEASATAYQNWFDTNAANGFVTTLLSTTGTAANPIFAAVMEQNGVTNWYQNCEVWSAWDAGIQTAQANRYILKAFSEFGPSGTGQIFCAVYYHNDQYDKWTAEVSGGVFNFQNDFDSETTKPHWRPYFLSMGEDQFVNSAFTDTDVGSWVCLSGMTATQLSAENTAQLAAGRYPIHVLGGGTGSSTLFAAIFAEHDIPTPRTWRATGATTGFSNNAVAQAAADTMMETFMKSTGIRQAQFSVGKSGNILLERAYSWSELTWHTTLTSDVFLLANLTQTYLNAAIQSLYNAGQLSPTTQVYPLLGYTSTSDPRLQTVTVAQLLAHQGGTDLYDQTSEQDIAYDDIYWTITAGTCSPTTTKTIVDAVSQRTLDYTPGTQTAYSTYGYILLSYLVQQISGQTYYEYLSSNILLPGGYDVRTWGTAASLHTNDPVTQESRRTGWAPTNEVFRTADIFGGDGMCKEANFGTMALSSSASTMVKFIATHSVNSIGARPPLYSTFSNLFPVSFRAGQDAGALSFAESRWDGLDWAILVNTQDLPGYPFAIGTSPFVDVLCEGNTGVPGFLLANAIA